jgi:hypothetical protein
MDVEQEPQVSLSIEWKSLGEEGTQTTLSVENGEWTDVSRGDLKRMMKNIKRMVSLCSKNLPK